MLILWIYSSAHWEYITAFYERYSRHIDITWINSLYYQAPRSLSVRCTVIYYTLQYFFLHKWSVSSLLCCSFILHLIWFISLFYSYSSVCVLSLKGLLEYLLRKVWWRPRQKHLLRSKDDLLGINVHSALQCGSVARYSKAGPSSKVHCSWPTDPQELTAQDKGIQGEGTCDK